MKLSFAKACWLWLVLCASVADAQPLSKTDEILLKKNFYLLYLVEKRSIRLNTYPFETVRQRLKDDARKKAGNCEAAACYGKMLQFTDQEIGAVGTELIHLYASGRRVKQLVSQLKASGSYQLFAGEADTCFLRKVWNADARGINYILDTYIAGKAPLYPKIDAISFEKDDPVFCKEIAAGIHQILTDKSATFYNIPLRLALEALRLNGREEAARYEPMTTGENAASYLSAQKTNWNNYPYSVILVPGLGPEKPGVKLDPNGAKRCDSAAARYRAGQAPFLVVSGGQVHPNKTPYCEAVEMKKYMIQVLHIPASAIIIEPHARHTTTNLRNTNRIIYQFKIPANKPVLIVTDISQSRYITGSMSGKAMKELGYLPFKWMKKLSTTETAYLPSENARQINSFDPLDP